MYKFPVERQITRNIDNEKFIEVRKSVLSRLSIHFVLSRFYIVYVLRRHLQQYQRTASHGISNFDLACFRERASNRCAYVPWQTSQIHGCLSTSGGVLANAFLQQSIARRTSARDFLECFRCLVHVWALASLRSDTKGELTAFSRSYARVRTLMKSRFNRSHPAPRLCSLKNYYSNNGQSFKRRIKLLIR